MGSHNRSLDLFSGLIHYESCPDYNRQRTVESWCKYCNIATSKENFRNWSSGNPKINEFIRYTQVNASKNMDYLEWINLNWSKILTKQGAFSSIYSAVWMEGPNWNLDKEADLWSRSGPIRVMLMRLDNSQNISQ